jgi:pimeloyl-ACP methyl ester carboxylesterase
MVRGTPVRFGEGDLAYALRGLLYSRGAEVPRIIHESATGDLTPLAEYYAQRTDDFSAPNGNAGYHYSVLCAEDIDPVTDSLVTRATRGTFMGSHLIDNYRAMCRLWPHARMPAAHWQPVKSDVPALLLSGSRDPVTPAEGADAVAAYLSNSVHVVVPNGGHGVGGECVQRMIAHLITTGGIRNIDTTCVQTVPPTRFVLPRF